MYKEIQNLDLQLIQNLLNIAFTDLPDTDSKSLAEILALFLDISQETPIMTNTFDLNPDVFNSYV